MLDWVPLARDDEVPVRGDPTANGVLHWVPSGHAGLRHRMATIAAWIDRAQPSAMIVDVSVEVAVGRSVAHLIEVVSELGRRGVELVVLDQGIDTPAQAGGCCSTSWPPCRNRRGPDLREHPRRARGPHGPAAGRR